MNQSINQSINQSKCVATNFIWTN